MRPRKRVLLFCTDEERAGLLRYRMELRHPMNVTVVGSKEELVAVLLFDMPWDAMVHIVASGPTGKTVSELMEKSAGEATARVEVWPESGRTLSDAIGSTAHRIMWSDEIGAVCPVVVGAMRRKRGPKRQAWCSWPPPANREEVAA